MMWPTKRIDSLCEVTSSKRIFAADYTTEGVPFYRAKEISEKHLGELDVSTELFISRHQFEKIRNKFGAPKPGDILLTSIGALLGKPYVVKHGEEFYFKDGNLTWFRELHGIDSYFLYYWMMSPQGKSELERAKIGSAQPAFTINLLKQMTISLPRLVVQCRIASILSAYDDLIENNTRRIELLEDIAQMIYREWFVNFRFPGHQSLKMVDSELGPLPEGWRPTRLGGLCSEKRRSIHPDEVDPETPYIGLEHLPRKSVALGEWGRAGDVASTKLRFNRGEILFGKIRPYFHKVGVAPVDGVASSDAIVIVPSQAAYSPPVLCCVSSETFVLHATQTSQGTKMPRANWDVLTKFPLPLPDATLLERFNETINPIVEILQNFIFQNRNLRTTRDFLLPKLISGEIAVEAAAELVEQTA